MNLFTNNSRRSFTGPSRTIGETTQVNIDNGTFLGRILSRGSGSNSSEPERALEEVIDLENHFEYYRHNQAQLLNPRVLYNVGPFNLRTSLLTTSREHQVLVTTNTINLNILNKESIRDMRKSGKKLIHLGLIMVGIKGMTRKFCGGKVLLVLLDKSWQTDAKKATIATTEVDMSTNIGLFYCSPDMVLSINDVSNIVVGIQAKGYKDLIRKDGNLLITIAVVGRLTNSSTIGYKLNIDGVTKIIASSGIKFLEPMKVSSENLEGTEWNISKNLNTPRILHIPEHSDMFRNRDGSYSLRFSQYLTQLQKDIEDDTEDD